jgi:hypothetical protein
LPAQERGVTVIDIRPQADYDEVETAEELRRFPYIASRYPCYFLERKQCVSAAYKPLHPEDERVVNNPGYPPIFFMQVPHPGFSQRPVL